MGVDQHGLPRLEIGNPAYHLHDLSGKLMPEDDPLLGWMNRRNLKDVQVGSTDPYPGDLYQSIGILLQSGLRSVFQDQLTLSFKYCSDHLVYPFIER